MFPVCTDTNTKAGSLVLLVMFMSKSGLNPDNINNGQLLTAINVLEGSIKAGLSSNDLWKFQEALAKVFTDWV